MAHKFGFEVEYFVGELGGNDTPIIPSACLPLDGCRVLVELRSKPHYSIFDAFGDIVAQHLQHTTKNYVEFLTLDRHNFSPAMKRQIRALGAEFKSPVDIRSFYNKTPRDLKGATIASWQINISNEINPEYRPYDSATVHRANYGVVDTGLLIPALDKEFAREIKNSGRQPGEYAIKDGGIRLEYRSLPSSAFRTDNIVRLYKLLKSLGVTY